MNEVIVAVAGAGKTEEIASRVSDSSNLSSVLLLTFTVRNQNEDAARVASKLKPSGGIPTVMGWQAFLLNEVVRPYLPLCFPGFTMRGLRLAKRPSNWSRQSGARRFFTASGDAYHESVAMLAVKVMKASHGAVIRRLEQIYSEVYVDEAQDLCGNDLLVLEGLMRSTIGVCVVCDPRQSVVRTSYADRKSKDKLGPHLRNSFQDLENQGVCTLTDKSETHRFVQEIADFSDGIFPEECGFPHTTSRVVAPSGERRGVYLIAKDDVAEYSNRNNATVLRMKRDSNEYPGCEIANFGECKGMTRDCVSVIATLPIEKLISKGEVLGEKSAAGFYVAVTRARFSVAIAVKDPQHLLETAEQCNPKLAAKIEGIL
jgi:hypothetical protein